MYDVIIVGAGPAGLKAAEILAKSKKKVLVLEKNKIIGPKVCAAGITLKDLEIMPPHLIERKFTHFFMTSGKRYRINYPVFMIEREKLGRYMEDKARKAGAIIKKNCIVREIADKYIIADKKYYFKYLIGADGSNSTVRRHLNLPNKFAAITMQYLSPTKKKDIEIFYDTKKYSAWYVWTFPHDGYTSVGAGTMLQFKGKKYLKQLLDEFCDDHNIKKKNFEAALISSDYKGYKFNNIYLAGDAAGLANPFTGEGIYEAIISAEEIAKKIIDPCHNPKKLRRIIEKHCKLVKLLKILIAVPGLLHFTFWLGFKLLRYKRGRRKLIKTFMEY